MNRYVKIALWVVMGTKYGTWMQLDFKNTAVNGNYEMKQFHQNYGYDLEKTNEKESSAHERKAFASI